MESIKTLTVNFEQVYRLYAPCEIVGIVEAYKKGIGWFSKVNYKYFKELGTKEEQIIQVYKIQVETVQLLILKPDSRTPIYADFSLSELIFEL